MSLVSRLFLPVLIAILLAIGIEIFDEFDARNMADATVRSEAVRLRDTIQAEQARVFDGIRQVASLVAGSAAVRDGDTPGCQAFLDRSASALLPEQTISVTDRNGTVICSTRPGQVGRPLGSRFDLMAALKTDQFLIGDYIRMGASGAALPFALRYAGADGQIRGVVAVMLDVTWWKTDRFFAKLPENVSLTVTDRTGTILARRPDTGGQSGRTVIGRTLENFTNPGLASLGLTNQGLTSAAAGEPALVLATVHPSTSPHGLFVGVGIDPGEIQRGLDKTTFWRVLAIAGGIAVTLLTAGSLTHRFIRIPVSALVQAAGRLGAGDYRARTGASDEGSEFDMLARAFDTMAESLERREKERELTGGAARRMAAVLESTTDGICEIDRDWCIALINARARATIARAIVAPDGELIGTPLFEAFPEAVGSLLQRECGRAMADGVPVSFEEYFGTHDLWLSIRAFPTSDGLMICFQDVTARRQADIRVERTEAHCRAIVDTALDGMVVIDEQGIIQSFNPAAERLFGYGADELIGRNIATLMPARDAAVHDGYIWNYRRGADRNVIGRGRELEGCRKDGSTFPLELSVAEWRDGRQRFFTGFMRDVTMRRQNDAILQAARDEAIAARGEAERAVLAKSKFLAAASHDLRQPVQSLFFLGAALADGLRDHPMLPLVGSINQATDALKLLLDGLLDISKLDAGVVTPNVAEFSADMLIRRLGTEYAHRAERQGLRLRTVESSCWVRSDPALLDRILRNLIENALRYTTHGHILIGCRRVSSALRIDVLDTGIGIPPDQAEAIFEEFHRIDTPGQCLEAGQGTGLGLAIVRRLAGLLGHHISVASSLGQGSRFSIEVPLAAIPAAQGKPVEEAASADIRGLVMILDDEVIILMGLKVLLESWGYQVISAMSMGEAIKRLTGQTRMPDLIVADYRLADGRTGPEAIEAIRGIAGPDVPGIVLTGDTAPELIDWIKTQGFGILHKPVASNDLRQLIGALTWRGDGAPQEPQIPTSTAALTM
jgi:PAS domain S-box-containing protein